MQILLSLIGLPIGIVAGASEMPMLMKLLPQERYGQFCSANALVRGLAMAIGGYGCGYFLDYMKDVSSDPHSYYFNTNPDACFRYVGLWNVTAVCGYFFFLILVHQQWQKLGGLANFKPPAAEPPKWLVVGLDWFLRTVAIFFGGKRKRV